MGAQMGDVGSFCNSINPYTPDFSAGMTCSFWTKINGASNSVASIIIDKAADHVFLPNYMGNTYKAFCSVNTNGVTATGVDNNYVNGTEYLLVTTYDLSDLKMYMNNVVRASGSGIVSPAAAVAMRQLMYADSFRFYPGSIEDLRIYERGLSSAEVQILYYSKGKDNITNGLVNRWMFNQLAPGVNSVTTASFVKDMGPRGDHMTWGNTSGIYKDALNIGPGLKRRYR